MQTFSNRLIALRKEAGLTQSDLARIIQKKRSTVSGYETEGKEPDLETVGFLARYFGVSSDYLLGLSDERNHVDTVFLNDNVSFKKHYEALPSDLKPIVCKTFDCFYLLLGRDMQLARPERLLLYQKLLGTVQSLRAEVRKRIENSGGRMEDAVALSELMSLQAELKNTVSSILDELMQADMEIAFNLKNGGSGASDRQAM